MKGAHSSSTSSVPHSHSNLVHLLVSVAKTHRLAIRSSYGAEIVGASHGLDDAFPTLITLVELKSGILKPEQLKKYNECGNLPVHAYLTIDAESVYKSITSKELKTPAEKTLLGHVMYLREKLEKGVIQKIQWCDTRDMTADGHTKGCVDRKLLLDLMDGKQTFTHPVKAYEPVRQTKALSHGYVNK